MKRFIIACCCVFLLAGLLLYGYYFAGFHVGLGVRGESATTFVKQEGDQLLVDKGNEYEPFELRGVSVGAGIPGHFPTDYAIDKDTYLRWFEQIQQMGANTIRVYSLQGTAFYEAFFEYNQDNPDPLYLVHGVQIDDYSQNSYMSALDGEYLSTFKDSAKTIVDVIHGQRLVELGSVAGTGSYSRDISQWVVGYVLGTGWIPRTVVYTDLQESDTTPYQGEYLSATADASPFESMLALVGDEVIRYETDRYGQQRLITFESGVSADPFDYPDEIESDFEMYASFDIEHVVASSRVVAGLFASYQVYPYYLEFMDYLPKSESDDSSYFAQYVKQLNEHHNLPVVISEYGMSSSRAMMRDDSDSGRTFGAMNEQEQGEHIAQSYAEIVAAGSAGSILFCWQDEWTSRSWNTAANVDTLKSPYWSDAQTGGQSFGVLSLDPGSDRCVSYVDGDDEEWSDDDVVGESGGTTISMKTDEKYLYFMARGEGVGEGSKLYIPIDTTPKSGSFSSADPAVSFDRAADFLIVVDGVHESRVLVQERYDVLRATSLGKTDGEDPFADVPATDSPVFKPVSLMLQTLSNRVALDGGEDAVARLTNTWKLYQTYETGKLVYGDANPEHEGFNFLADFCFGDGFVEIKIPWQLLNFSNPSEMQIHDDYYEHYGVENMKIDRMYVGVGDGNETISLFEKPLKGWGTNVTYHERLKESYYIVQQMWANGVDPRALWGDETVTADEEAIGQ